MPIREFSSKGMPRAKIAFFKELPSDVDLDRFRERKFRCEVCTEDDLYETPDLSHSLTQLYSPKGLKNGTRLGRCCLQRSRCF